MLAALLGRVPPLTTAEAHDRRVIALPDVAYPGLTTGRGSVTGVTIAELTADDRHVIDAFEDDIYALALVPLTDGRHAWAYTCTTVDEPVGIAWDRRVFIELHLAGYVQRCASWRRRLTEADMTARTVGQTCRAAVEKPPPTANRVYGVVSD